MANHPNRSKFKHPASRPQPQTVEAARRAQALTQRQAADIVYATESAWRSWESGERPMHAGLWELFRLKTFDRAVLRALGLGPVPKDHVVIPKALLEGLEPKRDKGDGILRFGVRGPQNKSIADEGDCAPD